MLKFKLYILLFAFALFSSSCKESINADQVFYNGIVYTLDSAFSVKTAFAIKDGKIIATGSDEEILKFNAGIKTDLKGKFVYPGFQDAHCHFYGYGMDLSKIWLTGTDSYNSILDTLVKYRDKKIGGWLFGRGWDQNDWENKQYPDKAALDSIFPTTPVFLLRIDGHAALVNTAALEKAGINENTLVKGGLIEKRNGALTGILMDAAVDIVYNNIPAFSNNEKMNGLLNAQKNCFEVGLTSVTDAGIENNGLKLDLINLIDSLQKSDTLRMRINAMASLKEIDLHKKNGKIKTGLLNVSSFKLYSDGALGSRGACLLEPYKDKENHLGFLIHDFSYSDSIAKIVSEMNWQLNTHCIGDSAHRVMLNIYNKYLKKGNNYRWRIEHAQVINLNDMHLYSNADIIPSIQPVHATSDMYWAEERLGAERIKGAYAYKELLNTAGIVALGSDFPVENINPLFGFYAAVARKDQKNFPENGFMKNNALTREEALRAMTNWAAYASFTENENGSLEKGKYADFVILEDDIMQIREEDIWKTKVNATYLNGKKVFQRGE